MTAQRRRLSIQGFVQGVGFRPFVHKLASELHLTGWVLNCCNGVELEIQGERASIEQFIERLQKSHPVNAKILKCNISTLPVNDESIFTIRESEDSGNDYCMVLPDIATCSECLHEIMDSQNRRFRYPFTNCTNCGPRFSIIEQVPYDRCNTTMKIFDMCQDCAGEYANPEDRRFHAQPNACPRCGPHLELWDKDGQVVSIKDDALIETCQFIKEGKILAVKGLGGFHLMADATNEQSTLRLRERKNRKHKPFALMYPSFDAVKRDCTVSRLEEKLLLSKEAPIFILQANCTLSRWVAPGNPYLGVMLPYTPLHSLLMLDLQRPVIATSGNRANEPICIDEKEALLNLEGIADYFLVHNRPIHRGIDDSIVKVMNEEEMVIRRSRGYSSIPISLNHSLPPSIALGGQQKNTVAIANGTMLTLSQHLGDLDTQKACDSFYREVSHMMKVHSIDPKVVVADKHPEYFSTQLALTMNQEHQYCQHHKAHIYACMAERGIEPPLIGVSWDGTGYGDDGTIWGGEAFDVVEDFSMDRIATLRPFRLLCGEKAILEPRLIALSLLYEAFGLEVFSRDDLPIVGDFSLQEISNYEKMLSRGFLSPQCSSMGRLFDGVSALLGIRHKVTFEGQAAMELEFKAEQSDESSSYQFECFDGILDWIPMIRQIVQDISESVPKASIAVKFHHTLTEMILFIAKKSGRSQVVLSGGVFQNKRLVESTVHRLKEEGFVPYTHRYIPPNDGGLSCGQLISLVHTQSLA